VSGRDAILSKVRRSLGVSGEEPARRNVALSRLGEAPLGVIPGRAQLPKPERIDLFIRMVESVDATVARIEDPGDVPGAVAEYLRNHNMPQRIKRGDDPWLGELPWASQPTLEVSRGRADGTELVSLSRAAAGVAETGTLVLTSGWENPTSLNFLPETHIVCIRADDVLPDYEMVWARIRDLYGKGRMPRTVNLITGPSRSGDIEQTILLGAHGPRSLHVIVVGPITSAGARPPAAPPPAA